MACSKIIIVTLYEGQRNQQDMGFENLPNDVEEVRCHHEMLTRLTQA